MPVRVALKLRSLRFHSPNLCRVAVVSQRSFSYKPTSLSLQRLSLSLLANEICASVLSVGGSRGGPIPTPPTRTASSSPLRLRRFAVFSQKPTSLSRLNQVRDAAPAVSARATGDDTLV